MSKLEDCGWISNQLCYNDQTLLNKVLKQSTVSIVAKSLCRGGLKDLLNIALSSDIHNCVSMPEELLENNKKLNSMILLRIPELKRAHCYCAFIVAWH